MKIQEVNAVMDKLKEQCGNALLVSTVVSFEYGQSIAGYNSTDRGDALLAKFTTFVIGSMNSCALGKMGDYYAVKFQGDQYAVVAVFEEYCWGGIIDTSEMSLGMIMNVILPECIRDLKQVLS